MGKWDPGVLLLLYYLRDQSGDEFEIRIRKLESKSKSRSQSSIRSREPNPTEPNRTEAGRVLERERALRSEVEMVVEKKRRLGIQISGLYI